MMSFLRFFASVIVAYTFSPAVASGDPAAVQSMADLQSQNAVAMARLARVHLVAWHAGSDAGGGGLAFRKPCPGRPDTGVYIAPSNDKSGASGCMVRDMPSGRYEALWYGAIPNDESHDYTKNLQACMSAAVADDTICFVNAGLYSIVPNIKMKDAAGTIYAAFPIIDHMHVVLAPGTTLKLADNTVTLTRPRAVGLFVATTPVEDFSLTGAGGRSSVLDMNGAKNSEGPTPQNQAMIEVSGDSARLTHAEISGITFRNTPGTNCIVLGQSNKDGVALGGDWKIAGNTFVNNGTDTHDHSSVYAWGDDVYAANNDFTESRPYGSGASAATGGNTAFEIHGARQTFINNKVGNYSRGLWIASNRTSAATDILVKGNTLHTVIAGIDFYRQNKSETAITRVRIAGNTQYFDDTAFHGAPASSVWTKAFSNVVTEFAISDITIDHNRVYKTGKKIAALIVNVSPNDAMPGQKSTNIDISNNLGEGVAIGILVRTGTVNGLGSITLKDNIVRNCTPAGSYAISKGIAITGRGAPIDVLQLAGNDITDDRVSPQCDFGVFVEGSAGTLRYRAGRYKGLKRNYREFFFNAANRLDD